MEAKTTGKRVVSKGEYALIRRQEAVKLTLALCLSGLAFANFYVACQTGLKITDPWRSYMHDSLVHTAEGYGIIGLLFGCGAFACINALRGSLHEASSIKVNTLLTRPNTADLPAIDSLVRASSVPTQAHATVLLRPAVEVQETRPEELMRAVCEIVCSQIFPPAMSARPMLISPR